MDTSTQITLTFRGKENFLQGPLTVQQALKRMGLNSESYLVVRDGEIITEDLVLKNGEKVRIVAVISGGNDLP
jgi:sulfur carrier protein